MTNKTTANPVAFAAAVMGSATNSQWLEFLELLPDAINCGLGDKHRPRRIDLTVEIPEDGSIALLTGTVHEHNGEFVDANGTVVELVDGQWAPIASRPVSAMLANAMAEPDVPPALSNRLGF